MARVRKKLNVAQAQKFNASRSKLSIAVDRAKKAKRLATDTRWKAHPELYDYPGVDTPLKKRKPTSRKKTGSKVKRSRTASKRKKLSESISRIFE